MAGFDVAGVRVNASSGVPTIFSEKLSAEVEIVTVLPFCWTVWGFPGMRTSAKRVATPAVVSLPFR